MLPTEEQDKLVGPAYVAELFGCSIASVRRRKCGTKDIPRQSSRPLKFLRSDVHKALEAQAGKNKTPQQRANEMWNRKTKSRNSKAA
jgi:hypothetical protein